MRLPHYDSVIWPSLIAGLSAVLVLSHMRTVHLRNAVEDAQRARDSLAAALLVSTRAGYGAVGKELQWPDGLSRLDLEGQSPASVPPQSQPRLLVLVLSELSCSVCEEAETAAANKVAAQSTPGSVVAVLAAQHRRYAAAFARVNHVIFPVYYDQDGAFAAANQLTAQPLTLVTEHNVVISANLPITGRPEFSVPFHEAVMRLLPPISHAGARRIGANAALWQ